MEKEQRSSPVRGIGNAILRLFKRQARGDLRSPRGPLLTPMELVHRAVGISVFGDVTLPTLSYMQSTVWNRFILVRTWIFRCAIYIINCSSIQNQYLNNLWQTHMLVMTNILLKRRWNTSPSIVRSLISLKCTRSINIIQWMSGKVYLAYHSWGYFYRSFFFQLINLDI